MLIYPYAHYCHRDSNVNNFLAGSKNIVFCTHCSKINPIIEEHTCTVNDCINNLRQSELKINLENEQCVSNCLSTNYKFTYQSKYHQFCPEGTYNNYICEDCYPSGSICNTSGTELFHNYIKCKDGYYLEQNKNGSKNRYNICPDYYYHNKSSDKYYFTETSEFPENYNKLIIDKNKWTNKCEEDNEYKYEFNKICY